MKDFKNTTILSECSFTAVRSGGAGGQNVNKVATKIELSFVAAQSKVLDDAEKEIFLSKNATKIATDGSYKISCDKTRSQLENKAIAIEKFYGILQKTFTVVKKRKATKPTVESKLKKRKSKEINSEKKNNRKYNYNSSSK